MKSLSKFAAVALPLALLTGCASTSHTHGLEDVDITAIKDHFSRVEAHVGKIETHLLDVENTANVALETARSAHQVADEANAKVDRMFHKAMSK